jgi:hypothetical protein
MESELYHCIEEWAIHKTKSINHNEYQWNPGDKMKQWFFTEVHLLPGKLVPVVAIHPLGGSCANRYHMPNPQSGAAQLTQDGDHTSHEQSTRVPFRSPPGEGQEPLTITMIGAGDKHLPPLDNPHCTKPFRWQQPPRVTSEIYSETQSPSASRCNHSSNALGFTPNLTKIMNLWWRWVGGLWLSSQGCYINANGQEGELEPTMRLK